MFQLTREEVDLVKSHFAISRNDSFFEGQDGGRRKIPYSEIVEFAREYIISIGGFEKLAEHGLY